VLLDVLHVGEAGVVVAAQQAFGDDRLGGDVDHLVPLREVDVALRGGDDPDRARPLDVTPAENHQVLGRVDEGVDHEDLGPVLLGDLVDQRVGAALDEEGVVAAAQELQPVEEVGDQLELVVLDPLELGVAPHRAFVAGPLRAERDEGDWRHPT